MKRFSQIGKIVYDYLSSSSSNDSINSKCCAKIGRSVCDTLSNSSSSNDSLDSVRSSAHKYYKNSYTNREEITRPHSAGPYIRNKIETSQFLKRVNSYTDIGNTRNKPKVERTILDDAETTKDKKPESHSFLCNAILSPIAKRKEPEVGKRILLLGRDVNFTSDDVLTTPEIVCNKKLPGLKSSFSYIEFAYEPKTPPEGIFNTREFYEKYYRSSEYLSRQFIKTKKESDKVLNQLRSILRIKKKIKKEEQEKKLTEVELRKKQHMEVVRYFDNYKKRCIEKNKEVVVEKKDSYYDLVYGFFSNVITYSKEMIKPLNKFMEYTNIYRETGDSNKNAPEQAAQSIVRSNEKEEIGEASTSDLTKSNLIKQKLSNREKYYRLVQTCRELDEINKETVEIFNELRNIRKELKRKFGSRTRPPPTIRRPAPPSLIYNNGNGNGRIGKSILQNSSHARTQKLLSNLKFYLPKKVIDPKGEELQLPEAGSPINTPNYMELLRLYAATCSGMDFDGSEFNLIIRLGNFVASHFNISDYSELGPEEFLRIFGETEFGNNSELQSDHFHYKEGKEEEEREEKIDKLPKVRKTSHQASVIDSQRQIREEKARKSMTSSQKGNDNSIKLVSGLINIVKSLNEDGKAFPIESECSHDNVKRTKKEDSKANPMEMKRTHDHTRMSTMKDDDSIGFPLEMKRPHDHTRMSTMKEDSIAVSFAKKGPHDHTRMSTKKDDSIAVSFENQGPNDYAKMKKKSVKKTVPVETKEENRTKKKQDRSYIPSGFYPTENKETNNRTKITKKHLQFKIEGDKK